MAVAGRVIWRPPKEKSYIYSGRHKSAIYFTLKDPSVISEVGFCFKTMFKMAFRQYAFPSSSRKNWLHSIWTKKKIENIQDLICNDHVIKSSSQVKL